MDNRRIMAPLWAEPRELLDFRSLYWGLPSLVLNGHCGAVSLGEKRPEFLHLLLSISMTVPVPVAARSKAWFCGRSLYGKTTGELDVSLVSVVCVVR